MGKMKKAMYLVGGLVVSALTFGDASQVVLAMDNVQPDDEPEGGEPVLAAAD